MWSGAKTPSAPPESDIHVDYNASNFGAPPVLPNPSTAALFSDVCSDSNEWLDWKVEARDFLPGTSDKKRKRRQEDFG